MAMEDSDTKNQTMIQDCSKRIKNNNKNNKFPNLTITWMEEGVAQRWSVIPSNSSHFHCNDRGYSH